MKQQPISTLISGFVMGLRCRGGYHGGCINIH
uniref:Uncharacterized protein n=1 Tax=Arundo donax TaxID=35708 RepID=A0A0A8YMW6_ARUDO